RRHQPSARRGVVVVLVSLALLGLVGVAAITVDGGLLYLHLRSTRTAADAAAMAAACELFKNYPNDAGRDPRGTAQTAAQQVASSNGYGSDSSSTVTVNIPPVSGPYAGQASYAEVLITYNAPRAFSRIWGTAPVAVRARAVSRGAWVNPNAGVL